MPDSPARTHFLDQKWCRNRMSKAAGPGWACSGKEAGNRKGSLFLWINGNNMSFGLELSFLTAVSVPLALPPLFPPAEGVLRAH